MNLKLQHISFSFSSEKQILNDVSMSLDQGKIYALMGTNGAGKTTLFNIITGFIRPQSGEIYFREVNITKQQPYKINRHGVGRSFQDLRLINKLTVKENVILAMQHNPTDNWINAMLPEKFHRITNKRLYEKADICIEQFFLGELKHFLAGEISYGQQKLLSLACCVANGANLMLLDEPVAGVQPEFRSKIATLIRQLKEEGMTILLIEHNTDFISKVADEIFFLHDGKIYNFANVESLRGDKIAMEAYI